MNVTLRVDASSHVGHGHLRRCLTLADALTQHGARCHFICRDHDGHLGDLVTANHHQLSLLPRDPKTRFDANDYASWVGARWQDDAQQSQALVQADPPDWLIVDHYGLDARWEHAVAPASTRTLVIDDLANRRHDCDLLLDQTWGRDAADYDHCVPKHADVLCGSRFSLLRPEFAEHRTQALARRWQGAPERLLMTFGGADTGDLTLRALAAIANTPLADNLSITVIAAGAEANHRRLTDCIAEHRLNARVLSNCTTMARMLTDADIAIGAAGSSSWERACLGLPTILLRTADNQADAFARLVDSGCTVGIRDVSLLPDALSQLIATRRKLSLLSATLSDGLGADRVVSAMRQSPATEETSVAPIAPSELPDILNALSPQARAGVQTGVDGQPSTPLMHAGIDAMTHPSCALLQLRRHAETIGLLAIHITDNRIQVDCISDRQGAEADATAALQPLLGVHMPMDICPVTPHQWARNRANQAIGHTRLPHRYA